MVELSGKKNLLSRLYEILSSKLGVFILIILVVALFFLVLYDYAVYSVASNDMCGVCHSMEPFIEGVRDTPHGGFNCHTCHHLTIEYLQSAIVSYIVSNPSPSEIIEKLSPKINMYEECISCHTLPVLSELKIHQTHIDIAIKHDSCDICHNPHALNNIDALCLDCHKMEKALKSHSNYHLMATAELDKGNDEICLECHSRDATWQIEVCPESILGSLRGYQCFDCHQPPLREPDIQDKSCTDCHAI